GRRLLNSCKRSCNFCFCSGGSLWNPGSLFSAFCWSARFMSFNRPSHSPGRGLPGSPPAPSLGSPPCEAFGSLTCGALESPAVPLIFGSPILGSLIFGSLILGSLALTCAGVFGRSGLPALLPVLGRRGVLGCEFLGCELCC